MLAARLGAQYGCVSLTAPAEPNKGCSPKQQNLERQVARTPQAPPLIIFAPCGMQLCMQLAHHCFHAQGHTCPPSVRAPLFTLCVAGGPCRPLLIDTDPGACWMDAACRLLAAVVVPGRPMSCRMHASLASITAEMTQGKCLIVLSTCRSRASTTCTVCRWVDTHRQDVNEHFDTSRRQKCQLQATEWPDLPCIPMNPAGKSAQQAKSACVF